MNKNEIAKKMTDGIADKSDFNTILNTILKLGGGLTLLLTGAIFLIVASKRGGRYGDYPEFLIIGSVIMVCGLLTFAGEITRQICFKFFDNKLRKRELNEQTRQKSIEAGFPVFECCGKKHEPRDAQNFKKKAPKNEKEKNRYPNQ